MWGLCLQHDMATRPHDLIPSTPGAINSDSSDINVLIESFAVLLWFYVCRACVPWQNALNIDDDDDDMCLQ